MNEFSSISSKFITKTYAAQGIQSIQSRLNILSNLLNHGRIPEYPIDDSTIEFILSNLSSMDSNNFDGKVGVGEREGRVYSNLVSKRHYYLSHGIGRSGDITEIQPKAAGSSIIYKLVNKMISHALQICGIDKNVSCNSLVFPLATGMTCTLCLLTLRQLNPNGKYVIWSRIDQKSCFKSILTAGLTPIIVDLVFKENSIELVTDIKKIKEIMQSYNSNEILCVLSTTSCFAPRQPDCIDEIAKLCKQFNIPHIINNAYGLQCKLICKLINRSCVIGRVDIIIQSTDKNFMVPVGGAIVTTTNANLLSKISSTYPGRANISPILDIFITLLSLGSNNLLELLNNRYKLIGNFMTNIIKYCEKYNGQHLLSPNNTISMAFSIPFINSSYFGSMLFQRNISGSRVISIDSNQSKKTIISGYEFLNWGSHINNYPMTYFTVAISIGMKYDEINDFIIRLDKITQKYLLKNNSNILNSTAINTTNNIDNNIQNDFCNTELNNDDNDPN